MDGLFSHAEPRPEESGTDQSGLPAVTFTVAVPVEPDQAFEGFTDYIHLWWPVKAYSAFGSGTHPAFERDSLYEEAEDGRQYQWARMVRLEPPELLELAFTMWMDQHPPSRVVVRFHGNPTGATDVVVTHDGWTQGSAGREQFERYKGWPEILGYYARFMGGRA
jgi:uncharacterized protein YndB with AHSA1/START domain